MDSVKENMKERRECVYTKMAVWRREERRATLNRNYTRELLFNRQEDMRA